MLKNTPDAPNIEMMPIGELKPNPRIARQHPKPQIRALARSIEAFGFLMPILIDGDGTILAGHARVEACRLSDIQLVPAIRVTHLTPQQTLAYTIADNRLAELGKWDERALGQIFLDLSAADLDFSLEATGFSMGEIDLRIEGLDDGADEADDDPSCLDHGPRVAQPNDIWLLGHHRIGCASALEKETYERLMSGRLAAMVFTDAPYNVAIDGNVSGKGKIKHREFVMGSGEMSKPDFTRFLGEAMALAAQHSRAGALHYWFMDWRHQCEIMAAAEPVFSELKNLCVWVKDMAGQGSLYRSQHELVFVFKVGRSPHRNNIQLGRHGRHRANVWTYPAPRRLRSDADQTLAASHPTVKPIALVADAMLDASARRDIILDPFLGSGTSLLAAERVGRICHGIELDPRYVDLAIRRWRLITGEEAIHAETGQTFAEREQAAEADDVA